MTQKWFLWQVLLYRQGWSIFNISRNDIQKRHNNLTWNQCYDKMMPPSKTRIINKTFRMTDDKIITSNQYRFKPMHTMIKELYNRTKFTQVYLNKNDSIREEYVFTSRHNFSKTKIKKKRQKKYGKQIRKRNKEKKI